MAKKNNNKDNDILKDVITPLIGITNIGEFDLKSDELVAEPILDTTEAIETKKEEKENNVIVNKRDLYEDYIHIPGQVPAYIKRDIAKLESKALAEVTRNGTVSNMTDNVRFNYMMTALGAYKAELLREDPTLTNFDVLSFLGAEDIEKKYTNKEMNYFMSNNFDWFQINGTLLEHRGSMVGTSGMTMPTREHYVVCTVKQFADIIAYKPDGLNHGRHKASYMDKTNKTWYMKDINKFNLSKFIIAYAEGKIAKISGVPTLSKADKVELLALAAKYKKFDTSPTVPTGRKPKKIK